VTRVKKKKRKRFEVRTWLPAGEAAAAAAAFCAMVPAVGVRVPWGLGVRGQGTRATWVLGLGVTGQDSGVSGFRGQGS